MSSADPFAPGSTLLNYRLGERVSPAVWRAEDARSGKKVAIKVLSRQLPKDPGRRDALVRDVRVAAALYHTSLVNILEIAAAGEALVMIMDWVEGYAISAVVRNRPLDRKNFFRVAYQAADALKLVHARNLIHGNIAGDSILVTEVGQVKVAGLNLSNLLARAGQPSAFQQRGTDPKAVAYMAPEQISNEPASPQTDIFSLGLVLYEAATGRPAYQGANGAEVGRKIVESQPPNPKGANPNIDNAVLGVIGRCLFKDPFRRYKDDKLLLDDIAKADPEAAKFSSDIAKGATPAAAGQQDAKTRSAILFMADVAKDPSAGDHAKAAARMQQILGEAVYLFDGEVLDAFGPRMIAELKSVDSALEAGRKGEFDFSPEQQGEKPIPVRLLLHAGDIEVKDGSVGGPAVTKAIEVLQALPPMKLFVSEDFAKRGRGSVRLRDSGAKAGVKLYTIVAPEPQPAQPAVVDEEVEELEAQEEEAEAAAVAAAGAKKKRQMMMLAGAAVVILGGGVGAAVLLMSKPKASSTPTYAASVLKPTSTAPQPATAETPRKIFLQPFAVDGTDATLADRGNVVRLASIEVLRAYPELRIADAAAPDAAAYSATVRGGATGPEIVTGMTSTPMLDNASGIQAVVQYVSNDLKLPQHPAAASAAAYNAFADAVTANAANDPKKTEAALRATIKEDPNFPPTALFAMHFYGAQGKEPEAAGAAKQVFASDPKNLEAARTVAHFGLKIGDLATALSTYAVILKENPADIEALNVIGRYAFSANDSAKFEAALQRLSAQPSAAIIHQPDLLLATGKIDSAAQAYYTVEEKVQNNPSLALKIGKCAVLRHSNEMADLELKKLQDTDPNYGLHILKAYIAASAGAKADADAELNAALPASKPGDDYWTTVAEVAVISGDSPRVLDALKKAVDRKEPTASYILSNPLFAYLQSEADFQGLRERLVAQQNEVRSALAGVTL
ncbi:MAG TPA: protein kinase [Thermoanaerobaculia bacterium]|nr:protein kinase [Thermoanaerobaculia bacterium]